MHIVDRRLNPGGKSLGNRQRFLRRAKALIRKAVRESSASRSIKDVDAGGRGRAPRRRACTSRRSIAAPAAACATTCCPATSSTSRATPSRARRAAAAAAAPRAVRTATGEDDFRFALSRDEFLDLFLDDLELPDLAKRRVVDSESVELAPRRLFGHRLAGQPGAAAHDAQQPVAPHRAEAPEARRAAASCAPRSQALEPDGDETGAARRA